MNKLEAEVFVLNTVNRAMNEFGSILRGIFEPFVGETVLTKEGKLLESIVERMPKFPNTDKLVIFGKRTKHKNLITFTIVGSKRHTKGELERRESFLYVAALKDGKIVSLLDPVTLPTDYTYQGVMEKKQRAKEAHKKMLEAQENYLECERDCYPFDPL